MYHSSRAYNDIYDGQKIGDKMDRQAFAKCIGNAMRGKHFAKEQRKVEFCITAKTCSGKAKDRATAITQCKQAHPDWKY